VAADHEEGSHFLILFLWTFVFEDSANLAVLSLGVGVASSRKSDFVPRRRGSNTSNRPEVRANATFLTKLSNKEIHLKISLRLGLIFCPIGDVLGNQIAIKCRQTTGIKVLGGKYKMIKILKNVCLSLQISTCQPFSMGLFVTSTSISPVMTKLNLTMDNSLAINIIV
jgi:hypothetical protein